MTAQNGINPSDYPESSRKEADEILLNLNMGQTINDLDGSDLALLVYFHGEQYLNDFVEAIKSFAGVN